MQNNQRGMSIGLLPTFPTLNRQDGLCDNPLDLALCDWRQNAICAYANYLKNGWNGPYGIWNDASQYCGCYGQDLKTE